MSIQAVTDTLVTTGYSKALTPDNNKYPGMVSVFNLRIWGTFVGTVRLVSRADPASPWLPCTIGSDASFYTWTAGVNTSFEEGEDGVEYAIECTAYTSGTINIRFGQ